jgi:hypothetical protein
VAVACPSLASQAVLDIIHDYVNRMRETEEAVPRLKKRPRKVTTWNEDPEEDVETEPVFSAPLNDEMYSKSPSIRTNFSIGLSF